MDIAELKELEQAIIPGPWHSKWDGTLGRCSVTAGKPTSLNISVHRGGYGNMPPEAEFIRTMRNLAPEFLAVIHAAKNAMALEPNHELRSLREEQLQEALDAWHEKAQSI